MAAEITTEAVSPAQTADGQDGHSAEWEPPMPPTELIFDDGEPLESNFLSIYSPFAVRGENAFIQAEPYINPHQLSSSRKGDRFSYIKTLDC